MTPRPRLGIHCPGTGTGGPWRYVHSLLQHIDLDEFDVHLICDIDGDYAPRPEIRVIAINPSPARSASEGSGHPIAHASSTSRRLIPSQLRLVAGFARSARRLARVLTPHKLDIFHTQCTGCEDAPVAARLAGIPHILGTFHTDSTYDLHHERDGFEYQLLERVSNRSLHRAIAVSHATGRDWRRRTFIPAHRITAIHNGIDASRFQRGQSRDDARRELAIPAEAFVVAGLGRLDQAKGFADLIDAAAMIQHKLPNLLLVIAGDGPLRLALEAHASARKVNARFLGFRSEVQPVLDAAKVFALPSLCEACPYALLEAMSTGLAVLGSDVGGVSELLRGGAGIVLPAQSPHAWATAMRTLSGDATLGEQLGTAARERVVEQFQDNEMCRNTFTVYRAMLRGVRS